MVKRMSPIDIEWERKLRSLNTSRNFQCDAPHPVLEPLACVVWQPTTFQFPGMSTFQTQQIAMEAMVRSQYETCQMPYYPQKYKIIDSKMPYGRSRM